VKGLSLVCGPPSVLQPMSAPWDVVQICPICKTEQSFAEYRDKKMRCQREGCGGYRFKNKVSWVRGEARRVVASRP
jgi:hypothetical protein